MNWEQMIRDKMEVGDILYNPGGGKSTISSITEHKVCYVRGKSSISLYYLDIRQVYQRFQGTRITSSDLKVFKPTVFDSSQGGHSCNCTFIFMLFEILGLSRGEIKGDGVKGSPYIIYLNKHRDQQQATRVHQSALKEIASTKELSINELSTKELSTKKVSTQELSTKEINNQEVNTKEISSKEVENKEISNKEISNNKEINAKEINIEEVRTKKINDEETTEVDAEGVLQYITHPLVLLSATLALLMLIQARFF